MSYKPIYKRDYKYNVPFSASFTKFKYLEECERKYALYTYGSWDKGAEALGLSIEQQFEVRKLKRLDTLDIMVGTAVHSTLADLALKKRRNELRQNDVNLEKIRNIIKNKYNIAKKLAFKNNEEALNGMMLASGEKMIAEIYLSRKNKEDLYKELREKNEDILEKINILTANMLNSPVFLEIIEPTTEIGLVEVDDFPSFNFHNSLVFANIDLSYKLPLSKSNVVIDWKTGKPDIKRDKKQLLLYSLYISEKFYNGDLSCLKDMFFINEYLLIGKRYTHLIGINEIEDFKINFSDKIDLIRNKLIDKDNNIPFSIERFKKCDDITNICNMCDMERVCKQI